MEWKALPECTDGRTGSGIVTEEMSFACGDDDDVAGAVTVSCECGRPSEQSVQSAEAAAGSSARAKGASVSAWIGAEGEA